MAASTLSRFALQTARLTVATLRQQTFTACPYRSFSVSSCFFGRKRFTEKHEWVEVKEGTNQCTVGISDHAQDSLGEIVFVELPEVGIELEQGESVGCVESVKAASDIYCPLAGKVVEVNGRLVEEPQLINRSALDQGWLFKLDVVDISEMDHLMDENAYKKFLETES